MKRIVILPLSAMLAVTACVAPNRPAPAPAPTPAPRPTPAPAPVASEQYRGDWSVDPLTPAGDWRYARIGSSSTAIFTTARGEDALQLACNSGSIALTRRVAPTGAPAELRIRTTFGERRLPVEAAPSAQGMTARLPATDPLWDQIAFSRGRFLLETTGQAPMIVPARPELGRVIEDCR